MLKRTLCFTSPAQLSLKNAQLVITIKGIPDEVRTVPIEDTGMVIIENQMVSVTMPLLNELVDNGVAVILCDKKGMPHAMLQNLDANNLQGEFLRNQTRQERVIMSTKSMWEKCRRNSYGNRLWSLKSATKLHYWTSCMAKGISSNLYTPT